MRNPISILSILPGDVLVEGSGRDRKTTKVDTIEHNACSSRGTHVNGRDCYERAAEVDVIEGKGPKAARDLSFFELSLNV